MSTKSNFQKNLAAAPQSNSSFKWKKQSKKKATLLPPHNYDVRCTHCTQVLHGNEISSTNGPIKASNESDCQCPITAVFDLDETLMYHLGRNNDVKQELSDTIVPRAYLKALVEYLERSKPLLESVIWTHGRRNYAATFVAKHFSMSSSDQAVRNTYLKPKVHSHAIFAELGGSEGHKEIKRLGRTKERVLLIENNTNCVAEDDKSNTVIVSDFVVPANEASNFGRPATSQRKRSLRAQVREDLSLLNIIELLEQILQSAQAGEPCPVANTLANSSFVFRTPQGFYYLK